MPEPASPELVLASTSPFRRRMLEAAGLSFRVVPADVDEAAIKKRLASEGAAPADIAEALARAKAEAVSARLPNALVIGADQVLALGKELLTKPKDLVEARVSSSACGAGRTTCFTAVALAEGGKSLWAHVDTATLVMRAFSDAFLERYLAAEGDRICRIGRRLRDRGPRHAAVRPDRGRHFQHRRPAAAPGARRAADARGAIPS